MRAVLRFVNYKTIRDPDGEFTYEARCVSGDDTECGTESMVLGSDAAVNDWMAHHTAQTGHQRFKRSFEDYAIVEPTS
ncbi:hypothetical protein AB0L75_37770 [Streptomyces sp. NPDC052101]|uniref:DUF7848 domain-containing protein n=1 Tax=Streptomyces sp. NPDC052101 TaxID=3155763 RepID=UPI00341BD08B